MEQHDWFEFFSNGLFSLLKDVLVPLGWQIVAISILIVFRRDFSNALARMKSAGKNGLQFDHDSQRSEDNTKSPEEISKDTFITAKKSADSGLTPWLDNIQYEVDKYGVPTNEELIRALAVSNRKAFGESVLRIIYGTQLKALEHLSKEPATLAQLSQLFENHAQLAGNFALPSIEMWMKYLVDSNLVEFSNGKYDLTPFGESFYEHFVSSGLNPSFKSW